MIHHVGTAALGASIVAFLTHYSEVFQALAAIFGIVAYAIAAYKSIKKK